MPWSNSRAGTCLSWPRSSTAPTTLTWRSTMSEAFNEPLKGQQSQVTDAMVDAYLRANTAYWKETDEAPPINPSKWRQGTPKEATRAGLTAALAASPVPMASSAGEAVAETWWLKELQEFWETSESELTAAVKMAINYVRATPPAASSAGEAVTVEAVATIVKGADGLDVD